MTISCDRDKVDDSHLEVLLFENSPYGNWDGIVQHDRRAIYFYLIDKTTNSTRACWVRNLITGPYVIDQGDLKSGRPPLMPKTHCRSSDEQPLPRPDSLRMVWFEEGNAAALFEQDQLLAVIPPWSGQDGFHGYSRECLTESPLAWPLAERPELTARIVNAERFWESCGSQHEHPFAELQESQLDSYRHRFGEIKEYYSLDGGQFPPRGAARFMAAGHDVIVTVGMAFRPQPNVELTVAEPSFYRRIELGIEIPRTQLPEDTDELRQNMCGQVAFEFGERQPILERLSGLVVYPWHEQTWLAAGHRCTLPALKGLSPTPFDVTLVADEQRNANQPVRLANFRGDPVRLLWLVPS